MVQPVFLITLYVLYRQVNDFDSAKNLIESSETALHAFLDGLQPGWESCQRSLSSGQNTGIQITGTSSNITMNVMAGDTVEFTVDAITMDPAVLSYRFFVRAGCGEPDWGGNKWTIVQPCGPENTVMHTFDEPIIYFLVGYIIYSDEMWVFGWPQSGIVVEVWPAQ